MRRTSHVVVLAVLAALGLAAGADATTVPNQVVYDNQLQNLWQDWSWASHNLAQTAIVHGPPNAISWEADVVDGLYFHHSSQPFVNHTSQRFWHRANGSQQVRVVMYFNNAEIGSLTVHPPAGRAGASATPGEPRGNNRPDT